MNIFNVNISKNSLLEKIGSIDQISGIEYRKFIGGRNKSDREINIQNPSGLNFSILPDRSLDISFLSFKSIPISWMSPSGLMSSVYYEGKGTEFFRTFYGGLLTTCGLLNIGPHYVNKFQEEIGVHGRISNISSEKISIEKKWIDDNYLISVSGEIREVKVFGAKLILKRNIFTYIDKPQIIIEDTVENIDSKPSFIVILYHINIGYPLLDKDSSIIEPEAEIIPRDKEAENGLASFNKFISPIKGSKEQVFYHDIKQDNDGNCNIALVNEDFYGGQGLGLWLKFKKDSLPFLTQWNKMSEGEYVCGIEPCNTLMRGKNIEENIDRLMMINPGEIIKFRLEFNILESNRDIQNLLSNFSNIRKYSLNRDYYNN